MTERSDIHSHPAPRTPQPAPGDSQLATRNPQPATRNAQLFCIVFIFLLFAISGVNAFSSVSDLDHDAFKEVIQTLSSFSDRSTGTADNKAAADYIKATLSQLDFEIVDSQQFATPVMQYGRSTLSIQDRGITIPIRPINSNAISPQKIPAPGISGPLIYVGRGEFNELSGKTVENAIILMELESGRNWLSAADLGAKALIYLDRGNSPKMFFEEKFELTPIQFPRFWMPFDQAQKLFPDFESMPAGRLAEQIQLVSDVNWKEVISENIYCIVPGNDPKLKEEAVMVEAFYDSIAWVAGSSPGADEACGVASLLFLARYLKENPPQRTVILVATSGHAQALAGMRDLVWGFTTRSNIQRKMSRDLKNLVKKTRNTITALEQATFETTDIDASAGQEMQDLVKDAIEERIKTESDLISRRLMELRLQEKTAANQVVIRKLADERLLLRQLLWKSTFTDLLPEERQALSQLVPKAIDDRKAILLDAKRQEDLLDSTRTFRGRVKIYDIVVAVSLHLSSHGDGFGAFNYGWQYPFRPRINRTAIYSTVDEVLRQGAEKIEKDLGYEGLFKDTLRPSRQRSWQSYFLDQPPLGGEVMAMTGIHGLTFVTTHDARAMWGTPFDTPEKVDYGFALRQTALAAGLIRHLAETPQLNDELFPRVGIAEINGNAKFLRHGELFADKPAPGTILLGYQGPARFYAIVDHMGKFHLRGLADSKHTYHKVIFEGYKFDESGTIIWAIDKQQTGKSAYRTKMFRRHMESDIIMFACNPITLFNLLEPRTFHNIHRGAIIDGRRESDPQRYWFSRLDTWISFYRNASNITTVFLETGTPLKLTLSDTPLRKKLILLNASKDDPLGSGYIVEKWPLLHRTEFKVARDMWMLLTPRIDNLEKRGIFNERIRSLQQEGARALKTAEAALDGRQYGRFYEATARSWALASRVYNDVEDTQKDVLYGVLFYIALFVPFAFCMERLLFSYANIYKRIIAFSSILVLLIVLIYNVHPAFQLAYSPMVVILAFFIMGLSAIVTLIIFFRFEEEMAQFQNRAHPVQSSQIGRWKAFVAAFLLGVSNLRRRRLRTALTCTTLIILTFTIMSFTSAKSMRRHARVLFAGKTPYQGFLLKNVNWRSLPPEAFGRIANSFGDNAMAVPRVWLEDQDRTRSTRIPVYFNGKLFEAQGMVGLSAEEPKVSGLDGILEAGRWLHSNEPQSILIPQRMADQLGIDLSQSLNPMVTLWGMPFKVVGIFSGKKLQQRIDLDGEPLTPVIFPREMSSELTEVEEEAMESGDDVRAFQSRYQHIAGDLTLIIPYQTLLAGGGRLKGVAVRAGSPNMVQATAQKLVDRFGLSLFSGEPDGIYLYNASDTMSYSGVPNIIIPLVISVFIVLNTMISSVYERKREIGIYTSVGLAPSHVSFLFVAEAMAFAVLSVVCGYLLAQTSAKFLAETALWSGITVNYSSMAGVLAMVLVIIVVLVSVIYPSKVAGEIAIPDVNRSWKLPAAQGNMLELTLPFLMTYREHRSVGGYLFDYFEAHQEISHGMFSTADIQFGYVCADPPGLAKEPYDCPEDQCEFDRCLQVKCHVWLAPFDFGIMQTIDFLFEPAEDEPGFLQVRVQLMRESGEANTWLRINKNFLHEIRKQLLLWRSLDDPNKEKYEHRLMAAEIRSDQAVER
ncbi:MAG: FtsX-like permease family protein [Desulfobacterales bacterium]